MLNLVEEYEQLVAAAKSEAFGSVLRHSCLANVVARRHPLNFLVVKSEECKGYSIRLHLWSEKFDFGQSGFGIHDHVFDIDSLIIYGKVKQTVFNAIEDANGEWDDFEVSYREDGESFLKANEKRLALEVLREDRFTTGDRYELAHGVLHQLHLMSKTAATLVLTRAFKGSPRSIGRRSSFETIKADRSIIYNRSREPMTLANSSVNEIIAAAERT